MLTAEKVTARIAALKSELAEIAPYSFTDGKHLDANTPERAYWHQGYLSALSDVVDTIEHMETALRTIAGAGWGHVAPHYEKGIPMTAKSLTIDVAVRALR